jgi:hypothetical protein
LPRASAVVNTVAFSAIVGLTFVMPAQATAPGKPVAKPVPPPAAAPVMRRAIVLPTPQPTCGPPVNLIVKFLPMLHPCPQ